MQHLPITQFGNPILRQPARQLTKEEIQTPAMQELIQNMHYTLVDKKLGVGLAAPQVGESVAIAVIAIRPLAHRPNVEPLDLVLINPVIVKHSGKKTPLWEGCISGGSHGNSDLFAQVPRYSQVTVSYTDAHGEERQETHKDLVAQIIQHEVGHLHGELFVDHVKDTKTFMTFKEYMQRIRKIS